MRFGSHIVTVMQTAQTTRTIDPLVFSATAFILGFLVGVATTLVVKHTTFNQKHLVNGVGVAILLVWTLSFLAQIRYIDYTTPIYIHVIAGMSAGYFFEAQNALIGLGGK